MWWLWMPLAVFCYLLIGGLMAGLIKIDSAISLSKGEIAYCIFWLPATAGIFVYVILAFPVILGMKMGESLWRKD